MCKIYILTHLAYRANAKKHVISNGIVTVLKAHGKHALADVNCYCKMMSVVALEDVKLFLRLKDVTYHVNVCDTVQLLAKFIQRNDRKLEEAEEFKCVFVVYCVLELK